jgi:hypothetical protein
MANNLEIGLRVQAALDEARKEVRAFTAEVQELGAAGKKASSEMSTVPAPASGSAPSAPGSDQAATARQAATATQEQATATATLSAAQKEQAEASDRSAKSEQELTKQRESQGQQSRKNEEQQQRQAKGSDEAAKATDREKLAIDRLIASLDPAATEAFRLAQAQNELNTALARGLITQDQHTRLMGLAQQRFAGLGVSAGQTAAAMRMLPAQITDITTSIASGMPIWLVAIQQGGQIKDSFGGVAPAFNAITSAISPAKAAVGGLALGVGALALLFLEAEKKAYAFNVAVQTTGNAAGATHGRIEALAEAANKVSGISKSAAESAAVAMVQSGRLGIDVIGNLTKAINGYATATGQSTDAAASSLAKLFAEPAKAAKQLDDQFNFLSATQRRHIADLVEQGRVEEAQLELSRQTADHFGRVVPENLGYLMKALNTAAEVARKFWGAIMNTGKQQTPEDLINEQEARVTQLAADLKRRGSNLAGNQQMPAMLVAEMNKLSDMYRERDAKDKAADDEAAKQSKDREVKAIHEKYAAAIKATETEEKRLAESKKLWQSWRDKGAITQDELDTLIKQADDKAAKKTRTTKANTPEQEAIQQIRSNLRTLQASIKSSDAFLVNQLEEGRVNIEEAYQKRLAGINEDYEAQREALEKELNAKGTTKTRAVELKASLKVLEQSKADSTRELDKWRRSEELKLANLVVRLRVDTAALTGQFDREAIRKQLELQYAEELRAAGRQSNPADAEKSRQQVQLLIEAGAAQAEFNNKLAEAQRLQSQLGVIEQAVQTQATQGTISQIEAEARIRQARASQVPLLQAIVQELERVRDSLPPEAQVAIDNMSTSIGQLKNEVAGATPVVVNLGTRLRNTVIDGVADAAANAVTNFKSLSEVASATLRQIAGDIVRSDIKRLLTNMFTPDVSGGGTVIGGIFGSIGKIFGFAEGGSPSSGGGRIVGPGTGTSDSIAALVDGKRPIAVSNNEFIQPEKAVNHYGLPFMEAVRTLRLPKPRFALGGLISASQRVSFATGGSVSSAGGAMPGQTQPVEVRFNNQGTPKQQVGQPITKQELGRLVVEIMIADASNGGKASSAINAAGRRN